MHAHTFDYVCTLPACAAHLSTTVGYSWSPTPYANGFFDLTSGATIFRSAGGSATDFDIALHKNGILHLLTTRASDTSITGATSVNLQGWGTGVGEGNAIAGVRLAAYQDFDAPSPGVRARGASMCTAAHAEHARGPSVQLAALLALQPVIFLTAAYDPADLSEVLLSAWNSVSGARVGSTRLVLPAGATANDKSCVCKCWPCIQLCVRVLRTRPPHGACWSCRTQAGKHELRWRLHLADLWPECRHLAPL